MRSYIEWIHIDIMNNQWLNDEQNCDKIRLKKRKTKTDLLKN